MMANIKDLVMMNDSIHGSIQLHPLCVRIIDTPQFQRLRHLKQLGPVYYVYPGASHNRFEHSIGVCHLAGKFVEILKANQPELNISDKDVLCVKVAGLCHDLGHGPFSHLFEKVVRAITSAKWKHEKASIDMLEHLIISNDQVEESFQDFYLNDEDKTFIKLLIGGKPGSKEQTGRGREKDFLYQIVANDLSGIDVDKWDYFARDCHMLGIKNNFDHVRCMQLARVCDVAVDGEKERYICYRDKEQFNLYEMFHTRYTLHQRAYKHKTVTLIDGMIFDALKAANDQYRKFQGEQNRRKTMSEAIEDMTAYTHVTDDVLYDIGRSTKDELQESRDIIDRITKRQFYILVDRYIVKKNVDGKEIKRKMKFQDKDISKDDIEILVLKFDYGKGQTNPMDNVYFYEKNNQGKGIKIAQKSDILIPSSFCEWEIRVVYKKLDDKDGEDTVKRAFQEIKRRIENGDFDI